MAVGLNGYLGNRTDNLTLRDWQHASRLYVRDTYRLSPKPKWMHYAVFNINQDAIAGTAFQLQSQQDLNYLVKKMDLPRYTLNVENHNQYNRKTTTYTKITYEPVNIVFHDDNNQTTNNMWATYYRYYFADGKNANALSNEISPIAYQVHTYDDKGFFPYRYGLDNDSYAPYFKSIQLITMSQHIFTSYLLCNPKILSWEHDTASQSEGNGLLENNMRVIYDAVIYSEGIIEIDNPKGFIKLYYDTEPSFLSSGNTDLNSTNLMGNNYSLNSFDQQGSAEDNIRNLIQNPEQLGNILPYGANTSFLSAANPPSTPFSTSGFQVYNFGSQNAQSGLNDVVTNSKFYRDNNITVNQPVSSRGSTIGTNINPVLSAPIDYNFTTGASNRSKSINEEFSNVISPYTNKPSTEMTDVFQSDLPSNALSSEESKLFSSYNLGKTIPEAPGAVDMKYFTENDSPKKMYITEELVNNDPFRQRSSNPFK